MASKTKAPSGLKPSRSGNKFVLSWKRGTKYSSQEVQYKLSSAKSWSKVPNITKDSTSASISVDISKSFSKIDFRVRGKKGKSWSGYATTSYVIYKPSKPTISNTLESEFKTKFEWEVPNVDSASAFVFHRYEWQTVLIPKCNTNQGGNVSWSGAVLQRGVNVTTGSYSPEETGWAEPGYSYTRWVRVRSVGPAGASDWAYSYHTYARSEKTSNVNGVYTDTSGSGYTVAVSWTTNAPYSKPVDKTTVQYIVGAPVSSVQQVGRQMITTLSPTSGSWNSINALGGSAGNRGLAFTVGTDLEPDQAIFVRVNTQHDADTSTTEGDPVMVTGAKLGLVDPSDISVSVVEPATRRAEIGARNNSSVTASWLGVYFRTSSNPDLEQLIGIIPSGQTSTVCQLPETPEGDSMEIGVKAFVADYDMDTFAFTNKVMESSLVWQGGSIPSPPSQVTVLKASDSSIQLTWDWTWTDATAAELSWADHDDAWESTDEPTTYVVNNIHANRWTISGLSVGTWYVRIRLMRKVGETTVYGAYSDIYTVKLSSSPDTPSLTVSDGVVSKSGSFTCYWAYVATDGTAQMQAEIAEAFINGETITYSNPIASTYTAQHITIDLSADEFSELNWQPGETHNLVVRVMSASKEVSASWSAPVPVTIADDISITLTSESIENITVPGDTEAETRYNVPSITEFPIQANAIGAGEGGSTTFIIERNGAYHVDRPDESEFDGFDGETIAIREIQGEGDVEFILNDPDIIGSLDDTAGYRLIAIAKDSYGQTATASLEFEIHWAHQAIMPEAQIEVDQEDNVVFITPIAQQGSQTGDVCDIYRLSADTPELIFPGAEFGQKYVDPYPTLGKFGGHRIVYRTYNGDYITEDNELAMVDYDYENGNDHLDLFAIVIDFDGEQLILPYDVSVSHRWSKDFEETRYLGGSIRGDWNPSVSKSTSLTTNVPVQYEPDNIEALRRLAVYPGACHVRTPDGSSFMANVEVKEDREERKINMVSKASLEITRIDSQGPEGMLYSDWIEDQEDQGE